jgi:hypothetical protein
VQEKAEKKKSRKAEGYIKGVLINYKLELVTTMKQIYIWKGWS